MHINVIILSACIILTNRLKVWSYAVFLAFCLPYADHYTRYVDGPHKVKLQSQYTIIVVF